MYRQSLILNDGVLSHSLQDESGTVFFNIYSGETLVLGLPLAIIEQQLTDPLSDLRQDDDGMSQLQSFISNVIVRPQSEFDGL